MKQLEYPFDSSYILKKKKAIKRELLKNEDFIEKRIALLSGSTIGDIKNIIELFLLNHGIKPIFYEGSYSRFYEDVMYDDGVLKEFNPDIIYIVTSNRNINLYPDINDTDSQINQKLEDTFGKFEAVWQKVSQDFNCTIIQNNFELPFFRVLGNKDAVLLSGRVNFITRLNMKFSEYARNNRDFYINDINYLSCWYGLERWSDPSYWYLYKYALNIDAIPLLCHSVANIIKSVYGKNKKSIVVDLDNTLWGGVIGDIGEGEIDLGNETPTGMAFMEFQNYIKQVSQLGILLNVASKNEYDNAIKGLNHNFSLLKPEDFICLKINWNDKNISIAEIARDLNILPNSLVFIDDNPAEREIITQSIPEVSVPEMTSPEKYLDVLDKSGFFEVTNLSEDDRMRNNFYKGNTNRDKLKYNFTNYEEYLKSLEMVCEVGRFSPSNIERITQLFNKTNQFNLTTRRYTNLEIVDIMNGINYVCIYARLKDKFGDNGIASCLIAKIDGDTIEIESWVMSCRVFKRNLEYVVFDRLVEEANKLNISRILGFYFKSAKNSMVKDFYGTLGFEECYKDEEKSVWNFGVSPNYSSKNNVIKISNNEE
ncbi:HAD-IIIC family phosphatase [Clostridium paridis]|uniref:HAD-IIIC family phosphatase n=1 Tax=Clostridium paridis TaxID=2803863 RepID=A0A937FE11_9CLOT|nr:HAD-IIIC family phosphatase [Clostridium paridis]MBL4930557.1 HAD-IIIC family phosphatase [Clostridium paridis]